MLVPDFSKWKSLIDPILFVIHDFSFMRLGLHRYGQVYQKQNDMAVLPGWLAQERQHKLGPQGQTLSHDMGNRNHPSNSRHQGRQRPARAYKLVNNLGEYKRQQ
jgi:hypothetical protein